MCRKIIASLLLIALLFNLAGHWVILLAERYRLQQNMAALIESGDFSAKEVETILIPREASGQYPAYTADSEFFFHDILYDVISRSDRNDTLCITCIRDHNEQNLLNRFSQYLKIRPDLQDSKKAKPVLALLQHLLTQALPVTGFTFDPVESQKYVFPFLDQLIPIVMVRNLSPPPWNS